MRALLATLILCSFVGIAPARDADGRYAGAPLKEWFDKLASGKGLCCSVADGRTLSDPDWGTHEDHYWVIVDGVRYAVDPDAVITEPNKYGPAVVWPFVDVQGVTHIRCFMPGSGT